MNIAIYHPSLNNFGGGETVALNIAAALTGHNVTIITHSEVDKHKLEAFFGIDLSKVDIKVHRPIVSQFYLPNTIRSGTLLHASYPILEKYEMIFDTCTNGWFDKKIKPKTICYVHFPFFFKNKNGLKSLLNPCMILPERAFRYDKIFCNSRFTKEQTARLTNKPLDVLYPPVEVESIKSSKKKDNRIVSIGRFTYDKKHEIMIEAFKKLKLPGYSLHLIGAYVEETSLYKRNISRC